LRPWKTNYQGKSGKAYAVSIEVRAESIEALRRKIIAAGVDFRQALELPALAKQLPAPQTEESLPEEKKYSGSEAGAITAEFYPEAQTEQELDEPPAEGGEPDTEGVPTEPAGESAKVAEATTRATADLKGKLASRKRTTAAPAPPPVEQPKPAAAPAGEPASGTPVEDLF
jgi:hypothetical protein